MTSTAHRSGAARKAAALVAFCGSLAAGAVAADVSRNTYAAHVLRIIDGDSYVVEVELWPGMRQRTAIRLRGVDTPELSRPSKDCPAHERRLAQQAKVAAKEVLEVAEHVTIANVAQGKFAGRVVADVQLHDGEGGTSNLKSHLLETGLAVLYEGGARDTDWCGHDGG